MILQTPAGVCGVFQRQLLKPWLSHSVVLSTRTVYERDYRRPGQAPDTRWPWQKIHFNFSKGLDGIRKHFGLMKDEFMGQWTGPEGRPLLEHMLEQTRVQWEFRGPESLSQWVVSSDREIGGRSEAYMKLGRNNTTCMLYGTLCSVPPRDGETRYSGYCTLRSKQPLVSSLPFRNQTQGWAVRRSMIFEDVFMVHETWYLSGYFILYFISWIRYLIKQNRCNV